MSASLPLFVVAIRPRSDNAGVEWDANRKEDGGVTEMIDLYRAEMAASYTVKENVEWAARERLARQARTSSKEMQRAASVGARRGSLLSRLVPSFGHAV